MEEFHIDAELLSTLYEASEEGFQDLVDLYKEPANDDEIELYIYLCFLTFRKSGNIQSLEQAMQRAKGWAEATIASHPDHSRRYSILNTLVIWDRQSRAFVEGIGAVLALLDSRESAINQLDIANHLQTEAVQLSETFEQTGRVECLDRAFEKMELAISIAGEYTTTLMMNNLGTLLGMRFERTGSINDLNQAISIINKAVDATPHSHPDRARRLSHLGKWFALRFKFTGITDDLNQALIITREAVNTSPQGHPNRASCLHFFANVIGMRFGLTGSTDDFNQAVSATNEAVNILPHSDPARIGYFSNLGGLYIERFTQTGSIDHLNQAISILSKVVDATPHGHEHRAVRLSHLGNMIGDRFDLTGSTDDLNWAVSVCSDAVNISLYDDPHRVHLLFNFACMLCRRFQRIGLTEDLNQAISIVSEAVDATPYGHTYRGTYLSNLGNMIGLRFDQTGSMDDLNQVISISSEVVNITPHDDIQRGIYLSNLGGWLLSRSEQTKLIDDLNQAISVNNEAVQAMAHNDTRRALCLNNLAACLAMQYKRTRSSDDLNRILSIRTASWQCVTAPPSQRIIGAREAARILMHRRDWEQSYQLLQEAIFLLHTVSPRFSNRTDAHSLLASSSGLASSAVSAALSAGKAPEDALRLLELGRGIIASLLMDMREDITDLQQQYPKLAEKLCLLRDELDLPNQTAISLTPIGKASSGELRIKRRHEATREFGEVIDTIRAQPGFFNFLQPPGVKELMDAAQKGPIIILNIHHFRCDAFLIQPDSIQVMRLSRYQDEARRRVTSSLANSDLSPLLEWLWHTICHPCLNALGIKDAVSDDKWPHIWWIPTGLLSQLPLHAAGIYKQGSKETVFDRAISSYASSIKALLHGRKNGIQKPRESPSEDSALIVSMQETPGLGERGRLPFATDEVHIIRDLCPQLQLAPIIPLQNKENVLKHLPKCKIFHFAGHGQSDPRDPSQSCLLLEDWETNPLTVGDIRDSRLHDDPPFLAYLSACSTGAIKATQLADEGIHLISAFQLAGFRHAIGTLWEVSDKHCVDVASILYKTLQEEGMTDLAVSRGLHQAVRALRDGNADDVLTRDAKLVRPRPARQGMTDFFWVPYVHFGV